MRPLAAWIMQGRLHAGAAAALFVAIGWLVALLMPLTSCLSGAAIALVTLRHGAAEGLKVSGIATAAVAVFTGVMFRSLHPALWVLCLIWLPALLCALALRVSRRQGWALVTAAAITAASAVAMRLWTGDVVAWWRRLLDNMMKLAGEQGAASGITSEHLDTVARVLNSLVAASMLVTLMATVLLARHWQARLYNPGGFAPEFRALQLPRGLAAGALLALLVAVTVSRAAGVSGAPLGYAVDLLAISVCALAFHGLAYAHHELWRRRLPAGWVFGLYLALLLLPFYVIALLAALALADLVFDFRARFAAGA
ncbi:MAG: hypothetical protein NFCOHLIN_00049 [Gammaproteobacteria bacterium]|nr:hypothetical protein [Gammaproteobacteria bacterium]